MTKTRDASHPTGSYVWQHLCLGGRGFVDLISGYHSDNLEVSPDPAPGALLDKTPSLGLKSQRFREERPDFSGGFHDTGEIWSLKEIMALGFQTGGCGWGSLTALVSPTGTLNSPQPSPFPGPSSRARSLVLGG